MPNIVKVFREEIARISRKEAKTAVAPLRKPSIRLRKDVAELKRRLAELEVESKRLQGVLSKVQTAIPVPAAAEEPARVRLTAKGIKSLRRKLGVSQEKFAKLLGVSDQAVYLWERKAGGLNLRKETLAAVLAVRGLTPTEAATRLEETKQTAKAKKPTAKRGKRK